MCPVKRTHDVLYWLNQTNRKPNTRQNAEKAIKLAEGDSPSFTKQPSLEQQWFHLPHTHCFHQWKDLSSFYQITFIFLKNKICVLFSNISLLNSSLTLIEIHMRCLCIFMAECRPTHLMKSGLEGDGMEKGSMGTRWHTQKRMIQMNYSSNLLCDR